MIGIISPYRNSKSGLKSARKVKSQYLYGVLLNMAYEKDQSARRIYQDFNKDGVVTYMSDLILNFY